MRADRDRAQYGVFAGAVCLSGAGAMPCAQHLAEQHSGELGDGVGRTDFGPVEILQFIPPWSCQNLPTNVKERLTLQHSGIKVNAPNT